MFMISLSLANFIVKLAKLAAADSAFVFDRIKYEAPTAKLIRLRFSQDIAKKSIHGEYLQRFRTIWKPGRDRAALRHTGSQQMHVLLLLVFILFYP